MKRSKHRLSNYQLVTMEAGKLIPFYWTDALPGDSFRHSSSALIRMAPMVAPVMHPVQVRIHHFFVPLRLIWGPQHGDAGTFEEFITGGPDGNDTQTVPTITTGSDSHTILDYMGIPPVEGCEVSALPVRAYNLIFREYYMDQDLHPEPSLDYTGLRSIAWEKDYFTSARPSPQKGDAVTIPLAGYAPVKGIGLNITDRSDDADASFYETDRTHSQYPFRAKANDTTGPIISMAQGTDGYPDVYADLGQANSIGVNEFRKAFALQRYQEARSRYGSRYTEYLAYLGVRSSDARLQRPEYLGGGRQTISFSEVLQTQRTDTGESPLGTMGGHGIASLRTNKYTRFFEEHGIVMSLMSIRPKTIYTQGIGRKWLRKYKEDYYQKELMQIGQQEVYNNEVYADPVNGMNTFGWQDRYNEYKKEWSGVCADFRDLLDFWHMGRSFEEPPVLNNTFVTCDPTKRIFVEQNTQPYWCMIQNDLIARRLVAASPSSRIL